MLNVRVAFVISGVVVMVAVWGPLGSRDASPKERKNLRTCITRIIILKLAVI